jgi:hypothetical protein
METEKSRNKYDGIAANARVGSMLRNYENFEKEVEKIAIKGGPIKMANLEIDDDRIDLAAAGVKDLNNFKGYHN